MRSSWMRADVAARSASSRSGGGGDGRGGGRAALEARCAREQGGERALDGGAPTDGAAAGRGWEPADEAGDHALLGEGAGAGDEASSRSTPPTSAWATASAIAAAVRQALKRRWRAIVGGQGNGSGLGLSLDPPILRRLVGGRARAASCRVGREPRRARTGARR